MTMEGGDICAPERTVLKIQVARIPVSHPRLALRTPMSPDAKLRVAKPFRHLILFERVPGRLELTYRNRFGGGAHDDSGHG